MIISWSAVVMEAFASSAIGPDSTLYSSTIPKTFFVSSRFLASRIFSQALVEAAVPFLMAVTAMQVDALHGVVDRRMYSGTKLGTWD